MTNRDRYLKDFIRWLSWRNPDQPEFLQAVTEIATSLSPFLANNEKYRNAMILERLTEPDRIISFRVTWVDDHHKVHVNRGYRVQFSNLLGPYKGGLRFHPSVNVSILKFLGFEQIFKNSLTSLPLGGGKGGSDFDPKGKSREEVMRFCHSFMTELYAHIGPDRDVPAGDIGVAGREIGFLNGQYRRISRQSHGILTGKDPIYGGSLGRSEATGYGLVYFAESALNHRGDSLTGKSCALSGSGNVSLFAIENLLKHGAKVVAVSDSSGFIYDRAGIDQDKLAFLKELKFERRGRLSEYHERFQADYVEGETPWAIPVDLAFPCATQNELGAREANTLIKNGIKGVFEGANMPCNLEATELFRKHKVLFTPGKASNAGGVAVSGLEMSQNSQRLSWSLAEVDERLRHIMANIHESCLYHGRQKNYVDYVSGANIAGFVKVAEAMLAYGAV